MYGRHPYAQSGLGTEETVASLTREDLLTFHQQHFRPDNLVVSLSGRIGLEDAIALIEKIFGDWQAPPSPLPSLQLPEVIAQPISSATSQDTQQSIVMLGYLAPSVVDSLATAAQQQLGQNNSDYAALKLMNTYLGNGLSSRLFVELREKRGLAYEVSAFYTTRLDKAQFVAYMGTAPENTEIALNGLRAEIDRLTTLPLSLDELQAAKNKMLGQYALGKQTNAQIAQTYGWYETLGLGIDFDRVFQTQISNTTSEQVQQAAQKYLTQPYVSLVGPAGAVEELAAHF
jgi:predicted Zn-dependent peptidase